MFLITRLEKTKTTIDAGGTPGQVPPSEPGAIDETALFASTFIPQLTSARILERGAIAGVKLGLRQAVRRQQRLRQAKANKRPFFSSPNQVQQKFSRHAKEVGFQGNYNKVNHARFNVFLKRHVRNPKTDKITGTHRKTQPVYHYYDPEKNILVMTKRDGTFISVWKLSREQRWNLYHGGNIQ